MTESNAIDVHLQAARLMIAACLERLKAEDPAAFAGAVTAMNGGASCRITTALSTAGLCEVAVELVDMQGTVATLAHAAFDPVTRN